MNERKDSAEMAKDLVDAIDKDAEEGNADDGLTKRERTIEISRAKERERKAEELKKQLRKRKLGLLNYRWSAVILIIGGEIAIIANFAQVMIRTAAVPTEIGFYTFIEAFQKTGGAIYLFPAVAGIAMIVIAFFTYTTPKYAWVALIPAMLLAWAGATVYFLITFSVTAQPYLAGQIYATFTPLLMFILAGLNVVAIIVREYE